MLAVFYREKKLCCILYSYLLLKSHLLMFSHSLCLFLVFSFRILKIAALALSYTFGFYPVFRYMELSSKYLDFFDRVFETDTCSWLIQHISVFLSEELMQRIDSMAKSFSNGFILVKKYCIM